MSAGAAVVVVGVAALAVATGASVAPALAVIPLLVFLSAALTLAGQVQRSGLGDRVALALAARARGNGLALYAAVCALCGGLTLVVTLDGAVVLMVPVLLVLARRVASPFEPMFVGVVAVANAVSIAVPQGNPTNLVVLERLGVSPEAFLAHLLVPGIASAALCAAAVGVLERRALMLGYRPPRSDRGPLSACEWRAALALVAASLAAWVSPFLGVAPWWPFAGVVAVVAAAERERPVVPWRLVAQVGGLLIVVASLGLHLQGESGRGLAGLLVTAGAVGAAAAIANNLPASVSVAGLLTGGQSAYAASIGLAVGSLATPQGSVATLIASELAGRSAPPLRLRRLAPLAAAAVMLATVLLWLIP